MQKKKTPAELITPTEAAKRLGMGTINFYNGLRQGVFPFGVAFQTDKGGWIYKIPREAFEKFMRGEYMEHKTADTLEEFSELILPEEVAKRLNIPLNDLYHLMRFQELPFGFCYKRTDGPWVYKIPRREFEKFLNGDRKHIEFIQKFIKYITEK